MSGDLRGTSSSRSARWGAASASGTASTIWGGWPGSRRWPAMGRCTRRSGAARHPLDLGTLGGPNSAVLWPSKNEIGLVAGVAETAVDQPLGETWSCRFFFPTRTGKTCLGVVWENGQIRALPTLGGDNGFATAVNNRRQVVGWAENTVMDPTCSGRQKLQFHAVLWGPGPDQLHELLPLPADSTSAATAINDRGQAVGISGACGIAVGWGERTAGGDAGSRTGASPTWGRSAATAGTRRWRSTPGATWWASPTRRGLRSPTSSPGPFCGPPPVASRSCRSCPATTTGRRWASTSGDMWSVSLAMPPAAGECCGRAARSST